jgi:hypothetical protein
MKQEAPIFELVDTFEFGNLRGCQIYDFFAAFLESKSNFKKVSRLTMATECDQTMGISHSHAY